MRIIIAGGRDFNMDFNEFCKIVLDIIKKYKELGYKTSRESLEIVSGTCRGADIMGEKFAEKYNLTVKRFIPHWDELGKSAGHIRNQQMSAYASLDEENLLIACWDEASRGTKDMIDIAKRRKIPVEIIKY